MNNFENFNCTYKKRNYAPVDQKLIQVIGTTKIRIKPYLCENKTENDKKLYDKLVSLYEN